MFILTVGLSFSLAVIDNIDNEDNIHNKKVWKHFTAAVVVVSVYLLPEETEAL